jgi:hypothetical protein
MISGVARSPIVEPVVVEDLQGSEVSSRGDGQAVEPGFVVFPLFLDPFSDVLVGVRNDEVGYHQDVCLFVVLVLFQDRDGVVEGGDGVGSAVCSLSQSFKYYLSDERGNSRKEVGSK